MRRTAKPGRWTLGTFPPNSIPSTLARLIQTIESQLVPTQAKYAMSIRAEVYKLNVYGEFSFLIPGGCGSL